MKKKSLIFIAMVAVIGLFASCDSGGGGSDPCENGHSLGSWNVSKAATCEAAGEGTRTCTRSGCDYVDPNTTIAELGHSYGSWNVSKAATCEETGTGTRTCTRDNCNKVDPNTTIPALGHLLGEWEITIAPTCVAVGEGKNDCTRNGCDFHDDHAEIPKNPNAHGMFTWALVQDGVQKHRCSLLCGYIDTSEGVQLTLALGATGPGGGKIFYRNEAGFTVQMVNAAENYTAYYLEVAPNNSSASAEWGAYGISVSGVTTFSASSDADASLIGNGRKDTQLIVTHLGTAETGRAAQLASVSQGGKNDWFLPSLGELYQLYLQSNLGSINITTGLFWSSSQTSSSNLAWSVNFNNGSRYTDYRDAGPIIVRAIRAF